MDFLKTSFTYENRQPFKGLFKWNYQGFSVDENGNYFGTREFQKSVKIVNPEALPQNTKITINDGEIILESNNPGNVDSYMEIGKYISPKFVKSQDMLCSLEILEPLTNEYFANQVMHYTGKSWTSKGLLAYQLDGNDFKIPIYVEITYGIEEYGNSKVKQTKKITKDFYIRVFVNPHYTKFLEVYKQECSEAESNLFNSNN